MEAVPDIREKIYLLIGLFCGRGASIDFSKFGAICQDIRPADVSSIDYRSGQWSRFGFMYEGSFGEKWMQFSGTSIGLAWSTYQFCPRRCLSCGDGFAAGSDVALGDAWNLAGGAISYGTSIIIAHTQTGRDVVQRVAGEGVLNLTLTDPEDIQVSQAPIVSFKIRTLKPRLRILRLFGYRVPEDERKLDKVAVRIRDVVNACLIVSLAVLGHELHRRGHFQKRPTKTFLYAVKIAQRIGDYLA